METPAYSGAVVPARLGTLPLAKVPRRRAKSGAASSPSAPMKPAIAASAALAAAGLVVALH